MARITVEDCINKADSRFELVMAAAQRTRKIGSGAAIKVDRDNDKNPVISLREIAEEKISVPAMKEEIITNYQRFLPQDDTEETIDLMDGEKEWSQLSRASSEDDVYGGEDIDDEADEDEGDFSDEAPTLGDIAGV